MTPENGSFPVAPPMQGMPPRVLVVRAAYHSDIVDGLTKGAVAVLQSVHAVIEIIDVAGALELPPAIQFTCSGATGFDGFVALGCVVKGDTDHYQHVCREAMSGLMRVSLDHRLALGNGVLTVESLDQAVARSGENGHNKGAEAAVAALMQINVVRRYVYYREQY